MSVGGDDDTIAGTIAGAVPTLGNVLGDVPDLIAGRYKIQRWLGGGGMGRVFEALDIELHEQVALKILKPGLTEDALERFRREVKLTRRIQHPNVARMFDIGDSENMKFLTMELVDGEALARESGKPLPYSRVLNYARQIASGLAAAHDKGVIHRDLKPDNVLVERTTGRAVLTDFGIARGVDDPSVTQVGSVVGTPRYMAPEQLAGRDADARSDLFALGVILYELVMGVRPWIGDNAIAIAVAQATRRPDPVDASIPAAFASAITICIELDPQHRPQSAHDLIAILKALPETYDHEDEPTRVSRPKLIQRAPLPTAPQAMPSQTGAVVTLAVLPLACGIGDEYLADAVLEDLIDTLSSSSGIKVRPAGLVRAKTDPDPREVGRALDVDHVVTGSIRRLPQGIRVSARLIAITDGFQIWAHRADGIETDVLAISEQLARGIASALSTRATAATRPTDPRAVDLYLRARAELRLFWGTHAIAAADLLDQALELSPTSAPIAGTRAYAATAAWAMSGERVLYPRAIEAIERALHLNHPEGFLAAASLKLNSGDAIGGARDLGTALVRGPMLAPAHEMAGRILVEVDAIAEARKHFETARGLDPTRGHIIGVEVARLDALEGRWEAADASIERVIADTDKSILQLGMVHKARLAAWRGDKGAMLAATTVFAPRMGPAATRLIEYITNAANAGTIDSTMWRDFVVQFGGVHKPVRTQLMGLQLLTELAFILDRQDLGLETLEEAERLGLMDVVNLDKCPVFEQVANHPRFREVRNRVADRASEVLAAFRSTAG
jgi:eukaryotic-like serine/threonine-protein kinase